MNDIDKDKIIELSSNDYISTPKNNNILTDLGNIWIFIIPVVLLLFSGKGKSLFKNDSDSKNLLAKSFASAEKEDYSQLKKPDQMIDKLSSALGVMKKVNQLSEIKKVTSNGQNNLDNVQEAFSIFKNVFSDTGNPETLDTLENGISTIKKFSEVKKVLDLQKSFNGNKNSNSSLDSMVEAISPLLSGNDNDSIKNLQKIAKMANLISSLNSDSSSNNENT